MNDEKSDHKETAMTAIVIALSTSKFPNVKWKLDSGSSSHMSKKRERFIKFTEMVGHVRVGNNDDIKSVGFGPVGYELVRIRPMVDGKIQTTSLHDVIYAP